MTTPFQECSATVQSLYQAIRSLTDVCQLLELQPLANREWYELLEKKLMPQLNDDTFLVVAVVGGTNIGKSVIFNHVAGFNASSTSPLASGTKHPVCLAPPSLADAERLQSVFPSFELRLSTDATGALEAAENDILFWREDDQVPDRLLILDTPDIDSDAQVNWRRADHIRRTADVLIAVLTQQKYNDAAVKQFFRKAAAENKLVMIVFNQCLLPDDEQYWPIWIDTFCKETGINPSYVYLAPADRRAAENNQLQFFERQWPIEAANVGEASNESRSLADDLSQLRFETIKLQTLHGSLQRILDPSEGVAELLNEVRSASGEFVRSAEKLSNDSVIRVRNWPTVPNSLLVQEIREWWKLQREGWSKHVHGFYDQVGNGVMWPFRFARKTIQGESESPWLAYQQQEWDTILYLIEELFDRLTWMSESGSQRLKKIFERMLSGNSREEIVQTLKKAHSEMQFEDQLSTVVDSVMKEFQRDSPEMYRFYRQLSTVSAAVRPMTSVVLFSIGWGPAGHAVAPLVADAAAQAVVPIVAEFAGGTAAAVAGESAVSTVAGHSAGFLQARFHKLQTAFAEQRIGWLLELLKQHFLGDLPEQLQTAAGIPQSSEFKQVERLMHDLKAELTQQQALT